TLTDVHVMGGAGIQSLRIHIANFTVHETADLGDNPDYISIFGGAYPSRMVAGETVDSDAIAWREGDSSGNLKDGYGSVDFSNIDSVTMSSNVAANYKYQTAVSEMSGGGCGGAVACIGAISMNAATFPIHFLGGAASDTMISGLGADT